MGNEFSVLMSLYYKESPENLRQCLESILDQTAPPSEIVIVKDGPLTAELDGVVSDYLLRSPSLYNVVALPTNVGLGAALREGILHCKNELVARMDTDDVARRDRFELQLCEFALDSELDVCGSHIIEFEGDIQNEVAKRRVPLGDREIKAYQKRRDAFNHMTVMYKRSAVLRAGNYQPCPLMEDSLLWVNMIISGAKCKNIDDYLVRARVGEDMFLRRGGFEYFKKYKEGRKQIRRTGYIGAFDYYYTLAVQLCVALLPNGIRGFVFKRLLHGDRG